MFTNVDVDSPTVADPDAAKASSHRLAPRDNSTLQVRCPPEEMLRMQSTVDGSVVCG